MRIVNALATNEGGGKAVQQYIALLGKVRLLLGKRATNLKLMELIDQTRLQDQRGSWIYKRKGGQK
jgi:hypothetical protein